MTEVYQALTTRGLTIEKVHCKSAVNANGFVDLVRTAAQCVRALCLKVWRLNKIW